MLTHPAGHCWVVAADIIDEMVGLTVVGAAVVTTVVVGAFVVGATTHMEIYTQLTLIH